MIYWISEYSPTMNENILIIKMKFYDPDYRLLDVSSYNNLAVNTVKPDTLFS
jgi:hypothetical protein